MKGINHGMVMQRDADDVCRILLTVTEEDEFDPRDAKYIGDNGIFYPLRLLPAGEGKWILKGIPVGGPYRVFIGGQEYTDIYVGDVWLLAGQSNMEGLGEYTEEDKNAAARPEIRELHMGNYWMPAEPVLHKLWLAYDKVHTHVLNATPEGYKDQMDKRCIGPGYFFGIHMYEKEGVPQGLIPCAHGGTQMSQWDPADRDRGGDVSLYAAMYRRFTDNGSHVRGLFWYQGCSDAYLEAYRVFEEKLQDFYVHIRRDFGADISIVQVQISGVYPPIPDTTGEGALYWSGIREIQRRMSAKTERLATAAVVAYPMADPIHIARKSQKLLAENAAELMHRLIHGLPSGEINVVEDNILLLPNEYRPDFSDIVVTFTGVSELRAEPSVIGFTLKDKDGTDLSYALYKTVLVGNQAFIGIGLPPEKLREAEAVLSYGYGCGPHCNLTDARGFSVPAFGPLKVKG